jgi:hypothetical protein
VLRSPAVTDVHISASAKITWHIYAKSADTKGGIVTDRDEGHNRRTFLKRATAIGIGGLAGRGVYDILDGIVGQPERAYAAGPVRRRQEQYLVDNVEVILDNGVTCAIPPLHNDVFTAKLNPKINWTMSALKSAQSRLEKALSTVEAPYSSNAAGLTMVIGWGLPFFDGYVPSLKNKLPVDVQLSKNSSTTQYAVLDAISFPSDPSEVKLEANDVMFKMRSDSSAILKSVESQLFDNSNSSAYIGDLFFLTSKRIGFLGRGFDKVSIAKTLAKAAKVPGADKIPDHAQLMMGFTSTQTAALGPDNIPSFETLPGVTNQFPSGYFASGCAMHLSHIYEDLETWYGADYGAQVARMFSPKTIVPEDPSTVTLRNGPGEVATKDQLENEASGGVVGHNSALQQATRLGADVVDNYGRRRTKGTAVPLREDFNTVDNPFAWWRDSDSTEHTSPGGAAGLHFVAFVPASSKFHAARLAMDGMLPDGTNLKTKYGVDPGSAGINAALRTSHRQNYLIPPRAHRSFPLVELLK